jgi:hypothetical protein
MRALIFLILDQQGEAWDMVAWCSRTGQLASWLCRAWAIGEDTIYEPRLSDHGALPIWRDPLRYLQANREGIVLVRPRAAVHYLDRCGAAARGRRLARPRTAGDPVSPLPPNIRSRQTGAAA